MCHVATSHGLRLQFTSGIKMKFCFFSWERNEPGVGDSSQRASNATHIDKVCHATIPSAGERQLRVVSHYKHLGAIKATTARLNPELMARCGAASLAKRAVPSTRICLRLAVASAIHSSLLYASIMWPKLPCAVYRALAATYVPPLRKAVNRQWPPKRPGRPLGRDEVLLHACCFVTILALRVARLRFFSRLMLGQVSWRPLFCRSGSGLA